MNNYDGGAALLAIVVFSILAFHFGNVSGYNFVRV